MGKPSGLSFLLDTHIWIWSLLEPERLKPRVKKVLASSESELWLSPISVWETLMLIEKGKVLLTGDADRWLDEALKISPVHEAPVTHEIARLSRDVDLDHQDPADRFLAATAKYLNLTLITADRRMMGRSGISVLPNA